MSSKWPHAVPTVVFSHVRDIDNAEKGLGLSVLPSVAEGDEKTAIHIENLASPMSPIHEGITPFSSVPVLSLPSSKSPAPNSTPKKPAGPKPKISRWILFQIWFNTYRKFFAFVTLLNLAGIIMAALNRFPYAENHLGALVLGNLLTAILMRNELFLRFLYTVAIYGLRSVC
jgi:hypothetical protein